VDKKLQAKKLMNIFRKLRWKLTFSYTLVTLCAFLVVLIVLGGIFIPRLFLTVNTLSPEDLIRGQWRSPLLIHILSQTPVDTELLRLLLKDIYASFTNFNFLRIGSMQFSVNTVAMLRALVVGRDGTLLGKSETGFPESLTVGTLFDPSPYIGLETPLKKALAGITVPSILYTVYEPGNRYVVAVPIIDPYSENENPVLGVVVLFIDSLPSQKDAPWHILSIAGRSLVIFLFSVGIMGALFGTFFARGLSGRFKRLATTTDAWSEGDFSKFIVDTTGDEISQLAERLNNMASQLHELLRRRQEMAVSEERNRLARDLHDSAKQQALAASFQLGTALALYDSDPQKAKKHLVEADTLVDSVRNELTDLVLELRPHNVDGQDFSEILKDYAVDWSQRCGIDVDFSFEGTDETSLETREALFRITQEALANAARHSAASSAEISLKCEANLITMVIKDNGKGFEVNAPRSGLGLASMQERTDELGGSFLITSAPGKGTQVIVTLPLHK
jgi:NarL family two-component system sensor histidine kinase LiaS